jgi:hypothetical protein
MVPKHCLTATSVNHRADDLQGANLLRPFAINEIANEHG